jgi:hypothetical protein
MGSSSVSVKKGGTTDGALGKTLRSELQRRSQQLLADGGSLSQTLETASSGFGEPGKPLPPLLQRAFGPYDLSSVQVHQGPKAQQAAQALQATAYTRGEHIVVGDSPSLHTLAHEAAHVVQQRNPQAGLGQGLSEPGQSSELHADAVASRVLQGGQVTDLLARVSPLGQSAPLAGPSPPLVMRKKEMTARNAQAKISKHYNRNDDLQEYCKEVLRRQAANVVDAYTIIGYFWKYTPVDKGIKPYDYYRSSWESVAKDKNIGEYPKQFDVVPTLIHSAESELKLSNVQKQNQASIIAKYQPTDAQKGLGIATSSGQAAQNLAQLSPISKKLDSGGTLIYNSLKDYASSYKAVKRKVNDDESISAEVQNLQYIDEEFVNDNTIDQDNPQSHELIKLEISEDESLEKSKKIHPSFHLSTHTAKNNSLLSHQQTLLGDEMDLVSGLKGSADNVLSQIGYYVRTLPVQAAKQFSKGISSLLNGAGAVLKAGSQSVRAAMLDMQTRDCYAALDEIKKDPKLYDLEAKELLLQAIFILKIYPIAGNVDAMSGAISASIDVSSINDSAVVSINNDALEDIKDLASNDKKSTLTHELKKNYFYKNKVHSVVQEVKSKFGHSSQQKDTIVSAITAGLKSNSEIDRIVARRILVELLLVDSNLLKLDADTLAERVRNEVLKG